MPSLTDQIEIVVPETNVDDLVTRYPSTASVFIKHRMVCVGCEVARFETLAEACQIYRKPLEPLLNDLRRVVAGDKAS
jgi:hybrid cluster-associated redox disulfide protein